MCNLPTSYPANHNSVFNLELSNIQTLLIGKIGSSKFFSFYGSFTLPETELGTDSES